MQLGHIRADNEVGCTKVGGDEETCDVGYELKRGVMKCVAVNECL
jgi:hypothetical protein